MFHAASGSGRRDVFESVYRHFAQLIHSDSAGCELRFCTVPVPDSGNDHSFVDPTLFAAASTRAEYSRAQVHLSVRNPRFVHLLALLAEPSMHMSTVTPVKSPRAPRSQPSNSHTGYELNRQ